MRGRDNIPLLPSSSPSSRTFSQMAATLKSNGSTNSPVLTSSSHRPLLISQPSNVRKYSR
ncbi:hypothetical protein D3C75_739380 [compost metagenome]